MDVLKLDMPDRWGLVRHIIERLRDDVSETPVSLHLCHGGYSVLTSGKAGSVPTMFSNQAEREKTLGIAYDILWDMLYATLRSLLHLRYSLQGIA